MELKKSPTVIKYYSWGFFYQKQMNKLQIYKREKTKNTSFMVIIVKLYKIINKKEKYRKVFSTGEKIYYDFIFAYE